ncbi:PH domain-containing protein [Desmospora activa]|uniref:Putative membrane protein n=1 Tax=Desmospora activa DSM 45169 TaxID=1121389 RepID=A0A2T4Z858_9BACL|nr:PH domain-containing protein [Desmospora activa]PTM58077.1 putative membrane protein [Desmospora activa DSM 45169]
MNSPQRLHPITVLFAISANLKNMVIPLLVYAGINLVNRGGGQALIWIAVGTGLVVLFIITQAVLSWYRQVYFVENDEFRMERGAWLKKKIYIPLKRIQSVDNVETIWHRLFGVVQVRIETASGKEEPEAVLEAVTRSAADQLKYALMHQKAVGGAESKTPAHLNGETDREKPLLHTQRLSHSSLLLAGLTSGRLGVVLALLGPILSFADDVFRIDEGMIRGAYLWATGILSIGWLLFTVLLFSWLISIISTFVQDYRFTISRDHSHLIIQKGLLERRRTLIPLRRIQAVHLVENLARQPLGYATLHIESAGYGTEEDQKLVAFPLLKRSQAAIFLERFLPEFTEAAQAPIQPLPRRVWKRMVLYFLPLPLLLAAALTWFFPHGGSWGWLLLPLVFLYHHWRYHDAGWMLKERVVGFRSRRLNRVTTWLPGRAMQSRTLRYTPLSRRVNLASFRTVLASGNRYDSHWLEKKDVIRLIHQMDPERKRDEKLNEDSPFQELQ